MGRRSSQWRARARTRMRTLGTTPGSRSSLLPSLRSLMTSSTRPCSSPWTCMEQSTRRSWPTRRSSSSSCSACCASSRRRSRSSPWGRRPSGSWSRSTTSRTCSTPRCTRPSAAPWTRRRSPTGSGRRTPAPLWASSAATFTPQATCGTSGAPRSPRPTTWPSTTSSRPRATCCSWGTSRTRPWSPTCTRRSSTTACSRRWGSAPSAWGRSRTRTTASWTSTCTTRPGSCSPRA
mmetsp:Transcript_80393/g.213371  ORF Transcript_80393/g.213371 Transcript_80393/m.213371 type:complete len:234 (+) Transcript_80393:1197-1898(+)